MKKIIVDPFTVNLPSIDLHGETTDTVVYILDSFIRDNHKLHNPKVVIIHGKGTGILRRRVSELLKKNKLVTKYYLDGLNDGQTIAEIRLDD